MYEMKMSFKNKVIPLRSKGNDSLKKKLLWKLKSTGPKELDRKNLKLPS